MYKIYKQSLAEEDLIAKNPHIGVACDDIRNGYRQLHIKRHIVFYIIVEEEIHITRILYDQMDFVKHLLGKLEDE